MGSNTHNEKQFALEPDGTHRLSFEDADFWAAVERDAENLDSRELAEFLSPPALALPPDSEVEAELLGRLKDRLLD